MVLEVLDLRVRSGEEEALMAVVAPTHEPGRPTVLAVDLEDLGIPVGGADRMALDDQSIAHCCTHTDPFDELPHQG